MSFSLLTFFLLCSKDYVGLFSSQVRCLSSFLYVIFLGYFGRSALAIELICFKANHRVFCHAEIHRSNFKFMWCLKNFFVSDSDFGFWRDTVRISNVMFKEFLCFVQNLRWLLQNKWIRLCARRSLGEVSLWTLQKGASSVNVVKLYLLISQC